jgi:hypothetical protein
MTVAPRSDNGLKGPRWYARPSGQNGAQRRPRTAGSLVSRDCRGRRKHRDRRTQARIKKFLKLKRPTQKDRDRCMELLWNICASVSRPQNLSAKALLH